MNAAKLKSHLYLKAVRWIAENRRAAVNNGDEIEQLSTDPCVLLCSHLWGRPSTLVAADVIYARG